MRPTNQGIQANGPLSTGNISNVGLAVSAQPVQMAIDDSKMRQLETLKQQLDVFNAGNRANAQLEDTRNLQRDQNRALQDYAHNPDGFDPYSQSPYYYQQGMDLLGERASVEMENRQKERINQLLSDTEKLRSTNVEEFVNAGLQDEMKGVNDPIILKRLTSAANQLMGVIPTLKAKQMEMEKAAQHEDSLFIFNSKADTPDNGRNYLLQNLPTMVQRLGKEGAMDVVSNIVTQRIASAGNAEEAQGWLALLGTKVPGLTDSAGNPLTVERLGGEAMFKEASKLRAAVAQQKATEQAMADKLENERRAAALKEQKEAQAMNFQTATEALSSMTDKEDFAKLASVLSNMDLSDKQREVLQLKMAVAAGKAALKQAADLEDTNALKKNFAAAANTDKNSAVEVAIKDLTRLRMSSDGSLAGSYVSKLFEGFATAPVVTDANGQLSVPNHIKAMTDVYKNLRASPDGKVLLSYIPERDRIGLRVYEEALRVNGGNEVQAYQSMTEQLNRGFKPGDASMFRAVAPALAKSFTEYLTADRLDPQFETFVADWLEDQSGGINGAHYDTPEKIQEAMESRFNQSFVKLTTSRSPLNGEWAYKDVQSAIYLGDRSNPNRITLDRDEVQASWAAMSDHLYEKGYKNVSIIPTDTAGNHKITYETADGQEYSTYISLKQFDKWTTDLARASFNSIQSKAAVGGGLSGLVSGVSSLLSLGNSMPGYRGKREAVLDDFAKSFRLASDRQNASAVAGTFQGITKGAAEESVKAQVKDYLLNNLASGQPTPTQALPQKLTPGEMQQRKQQAKRDIFSQ